MGLGIPELPACPQGRNGHETFLVFTWTRLTTSCLHEQDLQPDQTMVKHASFQSILRPTEEKLELLKELKKLEEEEAKGATKMLFPPYDFVLTIPSSWDLTDPQFLRQERWSREILSSERL